MLLLRRQSSISWERRCGICAFAGGSWAGLHIVCCLRGLLWCAHGAVTGRRGGRQCGLGQWRGLRSGVGAQWGSIRAGRVRGGRAAVVAAHASAYVAIGRLALGTSRSMRVGHGGHRWHWWCGMLRLLCLLLRASHTAVTRHFLGRRSRRLCYACFHAVRQLCICVPEQAWSMQGTKGCISCVQSPMETWKASRKTKCARSARQVQAGKRLLFNKLYQTPGGRRIASHATHFRRKR